MRYYVWFLQIRSHILSTSCQQTTTVTNAYTLYMVWHYLVNIATNYIKIG